MKKIIALLLVFTMLLPLIGCSTVPAETTGGTVTAAPTTVKPTTASNPDTLPLYIDPDKTYSFAVNAAVHEKYEVVVQRIPETVDNPDDLPVLKWVCLMSQKRATLWSDTAMTEINQMLAEKNMPFRLQLVIAATKPESESWVERSRMIDWSAIPEAAELIAEADLLFGAFFGETDHQYFLPITEYVTGTAQPSLQNAVSHELTWETVTRDAQIYGIPASTASPRSHGWRIDSGMLEKWGLTAEDFQKNFWEMDETFAKIYAANGNKGFLELETAVTDGYRYPGNMRGESPLFQKLYNRYQLDVGAGFCLDLKGEQPTVNTILESEEFRLIQQAYIRYQDAGYTEKKGPVLRYTELSGTFPYTSSVTGNVYIPVTESKYEPGFNSFLYLNGVVADTPYAAEAIQLLSLIAEDEAFRDHLCYGVEDRDYKETEGFIQTIKHGDGSSYQATFLSPLSVFSSVLEGTSSQKYSRNGKTPLETYREDMDNVTYRFCPIRFDFSGFETELAQLGELLGTYYRNILNTQQHIYEDPITKEKTELPRMDEKGYERVLQAQKDAGSDKIKSALQEQLDTWLEANPDWTAKVG